MILDILWTVWSCLVNHHGPQKINMHVHGIDMISSITDAFHGGSPHKFFFQSKNSYLMTHDTWAIYHKYFTWIKAFSLG